MADLLIPILVIIVMCLVIDYLEIIYPLLVIGFIFIPVSWLYTYQISGLLYDTLFNADISAYISNIPGFETMLQTLMWLVPILAFLKIYYVRNFISGESYE